MIHPAQNDESMLACSLRMGVLNGRANLHDGLARVDRTAGGAAAWREHFVSASQAAIA